MKTPTNSLNPMASRKPTTTWDRIAVLMQARGWRTTDLHRISGVSYSAFGKWEDGTQEPSTESLQLVAAALGVSIDQLLGGTPMPTLPEHPVGHLSAQESRLIRAYRHRPGFKGMADAMLRNWPGAEQEPPNG